MKISTKGRYGLRILFDLALHRDEGPRAIRDVAKTQGISEKYISRLIVDLRRAKMVSSTRGAKGGFQLAREPAELTLLDIVEATEGPISIVDCVFSPEKCPRNDGCAARSIWNGLNEEIRDALRKITLADVLKNYNMLNAADGLFDYCI